MSSHRELDLFAPTPEHALLADTLASSSRERSSRRPAQHDRDETFNHALFRRAGEVGLLGVTLPEEYGGAGLDAVAAVQVCEALATSDPGFALVGARARGAVRAERERERQRRPEEARAAESRLGRVDRRHVHDRAGRRHRRARDGDARAPRRRRLRARRHEDVHHQRRRRRKDARRRVRRVCRARASARSVRSWSRSGMPGLPARAEVEGQARHARERAPTSWCSTACACRSRAGSAPRARARAR